LLEGFYSLKSLAAELAFTSNWQYSVWNCPLTNAAAHIHTVVKLNPINVQLFKNLLFLVHVHTIVQHVQQLS